MNNNTDALTCLKEYVSDSEPKVNIDLRRGSPNSAVPKLDSFFENCENKTRFFRGLPRRYVFIKGGVYQDLGYVSTSKDVTEALRFALEEDPYLLVFKLTEGDKVIDVMKHLPDYNNEDEYILPHGQKYQVTNKERYSRKKTDISFEIFENRFSPNENMIDFTSLNVIYLEPLRHD